MMERLQIEIEFQGDNTLSQPLKAHVLNKLGELRLPAGTELHLHVIVGALHRTVEIEHHSVPQIRGASTDLDAHDDYFALDAGSDTGAQSLTPRERQIMDLLMGGLTNKAAARRLAISHRTVETHRSRAMQKVGAKNLATYMLIVTGVAH